MRHVCVCVWYYIHLLIVYMCDVTTYCSMWVEVKRQFSGFNSLLPPLGPRHQIQALLGEVLLAAEPFSRQRRGYNHGSHSHHER